MAISRVCVVRMYNLLHETRCSSKVKINGKSFCNTTRINIPLVFDHRYLMIEDNRFLDIWLQTIQYKQKTVVIVIN